MPKLRFLATLLLGVCGAHVSFADVSLPALWADHAVIQRKLPVHVWGKASPAEKVSVTFRSETVRTVADELGQWQLYLLPGEAGGPFTMEVEGANRIAVTDLLVGDVWLASGQSNMEFATRDVIHAEEALKGAQQPTIRLFHVERKSSDYLLDDVTAKTWTACTPESVANFSAVAYFFARNIQDDQKVPIGLIEADWGGTPAETWTSLKALSSNTSLTPVWATWAQMSEAETAGKLEQELEKRESAAAIAQNKPAPVFPWHPELRSFLPGGTFNGMIAPLVKFPIKGVIWYQGESNSGKDRSFYYEKLFRTLITDWRSRWGVGDFPFLFVQLANFSTPGEWPELREAQRHTLSENNTAMASAIDIGDPGNIHPKNKQEVGRRLSLAARALAYHENLEYSGPMYRTMMSQGESLRVYFDHASGGLVARGGELTAFEVAGKDGEFVPAKARVEGDTVVVSSPMVSRPLSVRYGWSANPICNLYNKEDLPASPFTSLP